MIDEYVHQLGRALSGPNRLKADLLTEARHSLLDAAQGYREDGMPAAAAERQAVIEFGAVPELVPGYQSELAASAVRTLALRMFIVGSLLVAKADLMWQGVPQRGPNPTTGYLLLTGSLDGIWIISGLFAAVSYLWLRWQARQGRPESMRPARLVGRLLAGSLGLSGLCAVAVYAWSLELWDAVLTWPPMLIGGLLIFAGYVWLGRAVRSCLLATRVPSTV
jgi:hypothetical protein